MGLYECDLRVKNCLHPVLFLAVPLHHQHMGDLGSGGSAEHFTALCMECVNVCAVDLNFKFHGMLFGQSIN